MQHGKREYIGRTPEKREAITMVIEKPEGRLHRCGSCNKPIMQGTLIAGTLYIKCNACGGTNKITPVIAATPPGGTDEVY